MISHLDILVSCVGQVVAGGLMPAQADYHIRYREGIRLQAALLQAAEKRGWELGRVSQRGYNDSGNEVVAVLVRR
jgi:hypothetical protein